MIETTVKLGVSLTRSKPIVITYSNVTVLVGGSLHLELLHFVEY